MDGHSKDKTHIILQSKSSDSISILCANYIKGPGLIRAELVDSSGLIQDASFTEFMTFLGTFESILPKETFDAVYEKCVMSTRFDLSGRFTYIKEPLRAFGLLASYIGSLANAGQKPVRVEIGSNRWNGVAGVLCKQSEGMHIDCVVKTNLLIPLGAPSYQGKTFLVSDGTFTETLLPNSEVLTPQFWASFFGHDAWVGMPFNQKGLKFIYRTLLPSGVYELRQFPGGKQLLDYQNPANFPTVTKIFMEIARIGQKRVGGPHLAEAVSIRENDDVFETGERNNDTTIKVQGEDGRVVEFVSLDLKGRIGEEGIEQLRAEFIRRQEEEEMEGWDED